MSLKETILSRSAIGLLKIIHHSAKWKLTGCSIEQLEQLLNRPAIIIFWHSQLLSFCMVPDLLPQKLGTSKANLKHNLHMLTSAHSDGQLIASTINKLGIRTVTGSSSNGGTKALLQMRTLLRNGAAIGITPDGPRGPKEQIKEGAVHLAILNGVPLLPCAIAVSKAWPFSSWDQMFLAKPFSTISMAVGEPLHFNKSTPLQAAVETAQTALEVANQQAKSKS